MPVIDRGTCPVDQAEDQLLYYLEPTDHSLGLACPECIRRRAKTVNRSTPCEAPGCGALGAWRNPLTRRDEFFCPSHHASSGDGVIQLPTPRGSQPHKLARRQVCVIGHDCRGGVQPRTLVTAAGDKTSTLLCTKHAGKTSAQWAIEDGEA